MDLSYINQKIGKGATNQSSGALKGLGRLLSIVFSVLLIIISVSGLATLSFSLFGLEVFKGVIPINMLDYLYLGVENGLFLKIAIISFLTLPFLGMLYGGIQLLFRFKTTRVRPGLIILLLWIISLFAVIFYTVKSTRPYWDSAEYSGQITLNQEVDTIYVRFISKTPMPEERVLLSADYSDFFVSWMDNNRELVVFPNLRIVRQSPKAERVLKYRTYAHANSYSSALVKAQRAVPSIQIKDSVITISPKYYNRQQKWDGLSQEISLNIPESVIIIVEEPLQHSFNKVIRKEGIFRFHKWERNFERKFDNWEHRFERKLDRFEDRIERFEERFD
ncbi:MAG: chitobiase/beta-hexosaminidase C-terminal domain-containing protein, partial [Bacteroidales bacterium]